MSGAAKILLVDDNLKNLQALEAVLEREEYHLIRATSGKEALKQLLDHDDIALIMMDVQMPTMDGFETSRLIKEREKSKDIPIIFLTAVHVDEADMFKGYTLGAFDYIIKPFSPELLKSKVAVFIRLFQLNEEKIALERERFQAQEREREQEREKEREKERAKAQELEAALEAQKAMNEWRQSISGEQETLPLRERASSLFAGLESEYDTLLESYMRGIAYQESLPHSEIQQLAEKLGLQGGGARDVADLHINVITSKTKDASSKKSQAYTKEGRLMVLELMGRLVDYYRNLHSTL